MCPAAVLFQLLVLVLQSQRPVPESRDVLAACWSTDSVVRFDGQTGAFEGTFTRGGPLRLPGGLDFGPDGNLYVSSFYWDTILKYDGRTGAFLDTFIPTSPMLNQPSLLEFRPDGLLYVLATYDGGVLRYDARSGAFRDVFIPSGSGGITLAFAMTFGPDGDIYLGGYYSKTVVRFDGRTGAAKRTVAGFVDTPSGMAFGPDGNLLVGEWGRGFFFPHNVQRYTPGGVDLGRLTNLSTGPLDFLVDSAGLLFIAGRDSIDVRNATTGQFLDSMSHPGLENFMAIAFAPSQNTRVLVANPLRAAPR
jgi:DNA-binding beta-propeller fold protein YncE